jgi:NAD(P)-dependent dehydrogenase (short-subunit alcohol dehydrogenase family)
VRALAARIDSEHGGLDVLVNDVWGGERLIEWDVPIWEHDLEQGLRLLRLAVDTYLITSHHVLPLLIRRPGGLLVEMTEGTADYNGRHYRVSAFYDLAKAAVRRPATSSKSRTPDGPPTTAATARRVLGRGTANRTPIDLAAALPRQAN